MSIQPNAELCRAEIYKAKKNLDSIQDLSDTKKKSLVEIFFFFLYSFLILKEVINLGFLYSAEAVTGPEVKPVRQIKTRDCREAH